MLQQQRRRDPSPHTWELPAGTAIMTLLLAVLGAQTGRSLANWFAGADWHWPQSRTLLSSIPAILAGNPTAGLTPKPSPAATSGAVIGWIITIELLLLMIVVTATLLALRRWGPGRMRGMATPADAETVLGVSRLRRVRHIIRPDLYPPRRLFRRSNPSAPSAPPPEEG